MTEVHLVHQEETMRLATARNAVLAAWREPPNRERMARLREATDVLGRDHPEGVVIFNCVLATQLPKSRPDVREMASAITAKSAKVLGVAHVIVGEGLIPATVRTVLSTLMMVLGPGTPTKVFSSVEEGAAWLAPLSGGRWQSGDLGAAATNTARFP
jgi:hypothetical protein